MTHARSFRESFAGFCKFYLGKVLAVASICLVSSLAGSRLLDEEGYIGGVPLMKAVDLCMIAMAAWLLYDLYREKKGIISLEHIAEASRTSVRLDNGKTLPVGELYRPAFAEYLATL